MSYSAYLIPADSVAVLQKAFGTKGTFLNPVKDIKGNYFLSQQEINSPQFQKLFTQTYKQYAQKFQLVEFTPPPYPEFPKKEETPKDIVTK